MAQKTTWIAVLVFGTLISFISCTKIIDEKQYEEFYYINSSEHDISITVFNKIDDVYLESIYDIDIDDDFSQEIELMSGSKTGMISMGDSISVQFGNERIAIFLPNTESSYNILDYSNYEYLKKDKNRNSYTYTFTENDFENADDL